MSRYLKSKGFRALNLPPAVVDEIAKAARSNRVFGRGKFCYIPFDIVIPGAGRKSIVVSIFDQPVQQRNIQAEPGDVAFCLREEWNVEDNPLTDDMTV